MVKAQAVTTRPAARNEIRKRFLQLNEQNRLQLMVDILSDTHFEATREQLGIRDLEQARNDRAIVDSIAGLLRKLQRDVRHEGSRAALDVLYASLAGPCVMENPARVQRSVARRLHIANRRSLIRGRDMRVAFFVGAKPLLTFKGARIAHQYASCLGIWIWSASSCLSSSSSCLLGQGRSTARVCEVKCIG